MSSISCDGSAATRTLPDGPSVSFADVWKAFQLFAVALTAVTLAACAQSSVISDKFGAQQTGVTGISHECIICR